MPDTNDEVVQPESRDREPSGVNGILHQHDRWSGRVALVTGASSGIGAAVAKMLVCKGMKVIGCAPNTATVERIQHSAEYLKEQCSQGTLEGIQCDVSKEGDILSMFGAIKDKYGGVDVCINNAGLAHPATLLEGKTEDWKHMFDVNVLGLCICTRESINSMKERKVDDGHIVNICSLSGHRVQAGTPEVNMYAATKHAVKAITEGLRQELRQARSHIRITQISPADVETEFVLNMYPEDPSMHKTIFGRLKCLKPEDIASAIDFAISSAQHVQVHDIMIRPTEQET